MSYIGNIIQSILTKIINKLILKLRKNIYYKIDSSTGHASFSTNFAQNTSISILLGMRYQPQ